MSSRHFNIRCMGLIEMEKENIKNKLKIKSADMNHIIQFHTKIQGLLEDIQSNSCSLAISFKVFINRIG